MEQNEDDPGPASKVTPLLAVDSSKQIQATKILDTYIKVHCALLRSDHKLADAKELHVPETGAVPVQPPKRRSLLKRDRKVEPAATIKRCWIIGDLFDAKADSPQALLVATDGTAYCSFAKLGHHDTYVEVTREFLLKQSGSTLIYMLATLEDKLAELPPRRAESA